MSGLRSEGPLDFYPVLGPACWLHSPPCFFAEPLGWARWVVMPRTSRGASKRGPELGERPLTSGWLWVLGHTQAAVRSSTGRIS